MTTANLTIDAFVRFEYKKPEWTESEIFYQLPRHTKAGELNFEEPRISEDAPGYIVWWTDWWWENPHLSRDFKTLGEAIEFLRGL